MLTTDLPTISLGTLAEQINAHHRECEAAMNSGLEHAHEAGRLLLDAKQQCPHGSWLPWLQDNFQGSDRTARAYMQVATRWPELESKRQHVATLTYHDAIKLLAEPKVTPPEETRPGQKRFLVDVPLEARRSTCTQWWDILASTTLLLDADGQGVEQIAATVGMPERDVELVLHPEPPQHDYSDFFNAAAQQLYRRAVDEDIENQLRWAYFRAQSFSETEYFPHTLPVLEAMEHRHRRQYERLKGAEFDLMDSLKRFAKTAREEKTFPVAISLCVMDDMRSALGIEIKPAGYFLIHFVEWCHVIEGLDDALASDN